MVEQRTLFGFLMLAAMLFLLSVNPPCLELVPRSASGTPTPSSFHAIESQKTVGHPEIASSFEFNAGQADPRVP